MSRTSIIKILYFSGIALSLVAAMYLVSMTKGSLFMAVSLFLLLLAPGRIIGYLWRDLLAGRRLLDAGKYSEAITLFERFQVNMTSNRWLNWIIWLTPSVYTTNAKALTMNNLGVCNLELGELEKAEEYFNNALTIDHRYPIPHYNLAILEMYHKRMESSERHLSEAVRLGFNGGTMDKVIQKAKSIYAKIEPMARHVR